MEMQVGEARFDSPQKMGIVAAVEVARQPALDAYLGCAALDGFYRFLNE
jgi:hypothetical protein